MFKTLSASIIAISLLTSVQSQACTVMPINEELQTQRLLNYATSYLSVDQEDVSKHEVSSYYGKYNWTPMCPDSVSSGAVFTVEYSNANSTMCSAKIKIDSVEKYSPSREEISIEVVDGPTCFFMANGN